MDKTILILLFGLIVAVFLMRFLMEGALKKLSPEMKLLLLDSFTGLRKYRSIGMIILVGTYFLLLYFFINEVKVLTEGFIVVFVAYFITAQIITYRKLKQLNAPDFYITRYLLSISIFFVSLIALFVFSYFQLNKKSSWEIASTAYYNLEKKNYKEAIELYNDAIAQDSNSNYFLNRGTAKYFLKDTAGACADWSEAKALGDTLANNFLRDLCK